MNLDKLFQMQQKLDEHILNRFPELENVDLLPKKILALQVELGELAQEWRGFKFWKVNKLPVTLNEVFCKDCNGTGTPFGIPAESGIDCERCEGSGFYYKNPLLEEYVDCLHFILSIGLERKETTLTVPYDRGWMNIKGSITAQFNSLFDVVGNFYRYRMVGNYSNILDMFLGLGEMLGFTWEQIEQAYIQKNSVNHERQQNGY